MKLSTLYLSILFPFKCHCCICLLAVRCIPLDDPENGMADCSGNLFEDSCSFMCDSGYVLSGSANRTCQSNGNWSGTDAICTQGIDIDTIW